MEETNEDYTGTIPVADINYEDIPVFSRVENIETESKKLSLTEEDCNRIADRIVEKLFERDESKSDEKEEGLFRPKLGLLKETETQYICMGCIKLWTQRKSPQIIEKSRCWKFRVLQKAWLNKEGK